MKFTRREFIRSTAVSVAAAAAGMAEAQAPQPQTNVITDPSRSGVKWHKAPCRFCGTGCGECVAVCPGNAITLEGIPA